MRLLVSDDQVFEALFRPAFWLGSSAALLFVGGQCWKRRQNRGY